MPALCAAFDAVVEGLGEVSGQAEEETIQWAGMIPRKAASRQRLSLILLSYRCTDIGISDCADAPGWGIFSYRSATHSSAVS